MISSTKNACGSRTPYLPATTTMAAMAQAYMQPNKGTLVAGQTIAVNKYTVQVERYLSQGALCRRRRNEAWMTILRRRLRARLSGAHSDARDEHDAPCLEADRGAE